MPPTVALAPVQPTDVTGALARHITHWEEVAVPHGHHFENYLAQDLRIIWRAAPAPCGRRLGVSAKRSMSAYPQTQRQAIVTRF
jgi:hypothetical protein